MDNSARLAVFQAQSKNVRTIDRAATQIRRSINFAWRSNDRASALVHTKVLALMYCAWAEATFSKLVHTPHGFSLDEIRRIKSTVKTQSIVFGWQDCIKYGLARANFANEAERAEVKTKLENVIDKYIGDPSQLRNRVAHGQWAVALNSQSTSVNPAITAALSDLSVVTVDIWFGCTSRLAAIVEFLVESPKNAFSQNYNAQYQDLQDYINETNNWTLEDKIERLKKKPIRRNDQRQSRSDTEAAAGSI